jgi:hypothetical protein
VNLFQRLLRIVAPTPSPEEELLPEDTQLSIATELALAAAVDFIILQKTAWNEMVESLSAIGYEIYMSEESVLRFQEAMNRLSAAMRVAGECLDLDPETLKELFHD